MLNSNNSTGNYGRMWARIRFRGDLYSQESTFPLVCTVLSRPDDNDERFDFSDEHNNRNLQL